ncbi:MAG TPA: protein kinase, partial [Terriglobia bacterium]|nr:protein kinase [Terriglobia bacterium]
WAFGCVLYEMLAGTKPFEGETVSETLASVIKDTPNLEDLPATTPRPIRALLSRCLHKDPKHRLQAIGEARIAIEDYLANPAAEEPAAATNLVAASVARPHAEKVRRAVLLVAGLALILGLAAGWWIKGRRGEPSPTWSAQMLGGPSTAFGPRISPDGHTLAFQAMVDGLTQVAVMDTDSGDWTVLTKDRSRGYVTELDWSSDGSEIYFDRQLSTPRGIYTVSRFGGEEHLILEDAVGPQVLPDGSLLVVRVNRDRDLQLYRFWPESGRVIALNGIVPFADLCPPVRAFHDGKEAVFVGNTPDEAKTDPVPHLYALDLTSGKTRRLAAGLNLASTVLSFYPLAVPADDHSVIADVREGDLHRIVAVPRSGSGPVETLLSLTAPPLFIDAGKDGTLYLDQAVRPSAVLRFSTAGGTPEILAGSDSASPGAQSTFQIPDGRVLLDSVVAGVSRLLLAKPGGDAAPFIATKEETSSPACRVGENEVAFLLGPSHHAELAIASLADGRILRRLRGVQGGEIGELVASRDGATLFYVASRTIWSIPAADGTARRLGPGDALTVDPNGHDLIVQLREKEGVRLVRVPVSGGGETPISVQGDLRLAPVSIDSSAVDQGGRMLVSLAAPDSWFYRPGSLDLRTGKLERIPLNFSGDVLGIGWQSDGRILSTGWPLKAALWRFRPAQQEKK